MFLAFAIFCLAAKLSGVYGETQIHERMSVDQVAEIFQTTHDSVPEYEIVRFHVPRIKKRDLRKPELLMVKAFGDDLELWVKPTEGVLAGQNTPVFTAIHDPRRKDIVYKEIPDAMKNVGKILEDPVTGASLIAGTDAAGLRSFNGLVRSKNLVVRSLPDSISEHLTEDRDSDDSQKSRHNSSIARSTYHVVFKGEEQNFQDIKKSIGLVERRESEYKNPLYATPSPIPEVIYPEIMVVVDYNLFESSGKNLDRALIYVLAFWNGVDLLYRSFQAPKIRFNIARVIITVDDRAAPYISENMYNDKFLEAFDAHAAIQRYYFSILRIFPSYSYDALMVMTSLEMTSGSGRPDVLGVAMTGGVCFVDYLNGYMGNVGLITDDGTFHGVATAAHEFGHLIGARHDDGISCESMDGYIMAPSSGITENSHDFSDCTIKTIAQFIEEDRAFCFYNEPETKNPLPRALLPGLLSDRDHQCRTMKRGKSCYSESTSQLPCTAVYCSDPLNSTRCYQFRSQAPPDGAYCAKQKICLHGKCVGL